jgi:drug/metabolite transporter (DMT)-like permease
MAVPVIGVVASALALHEPLGPGQMAALVFTLAGVALATRSWRDETAHSCAPSLASAINAVTGRDDGRII